MLSLRQETRSAQSRWTDGLYLFIPAWGYQFLIYWRKERERKDRKENPSLAEKNNISRETKEKWNEKQTEDL
jgi:hypothetical protein